MLLAQLEQSDYTRLESQVGEIDRFLGPGDKFRFSCDRSGTCCENRVDNPILLSPYDAHRLEQRLDLGTSDFIDLYAERFAGAESHLPGLALGFVGSDGSGNKCPFLEESGCGVYQARPLVCRLYPVGRIVDRDLRSYFFLAKTPEHCGAGCGRERSIETWLKETEVKDYLEWNDRFHSLFMEIDYEKLQSGHWKWRSLLGMFLYDFDRAEDQIGDDPMIASCLAREDGRLHASYCAAERLIETMLK